LIPAIAGQLKGAEHDFRTMVTDRARDQLIAVAGKVILITLDLQRIAIKRLKPALRHREGVVAEVDLAVLALLIHRKVDDPGEFELVLINQAQFAANLVAGAACDSFKGLGSAAQEKDGIAFAQPQLLADRLGPLMTQRLGDGASRL